MPTAILLLPSSFNNSMASFHTYLYVFFTLFSTLLCVSKAFNLTVGGKDGWTLHPSEAYDHWSGRLRFNVNDNLHFKYNGGSDSVMEVNRGDYGSCNTNNPITTLTGSGDSFFNLNRSGPFYFISGNKSNCDQGQKLTVVVLSPRKNQTPPTIALAPGSFSPVPAGGIASSSPTGNPMDVNAPAPEGSLATKPAISATLIGSLAMIVFGLGWVY
ncbi:putative Phytocyanin domain, cupredoxin [Helianthus annuus]|uniref:Phytocyanin domain, cupredoxin n=1 Tax=Helianthus annuus TaxID=4232 RepID=A0A251SC84_HELAN|nr:early nodulin-like protein 2 [Helianthus annuus]KAF5766610.1 putative Phytocyanin domain, cupredoxin [Helianthus annuus]KAJ0458033.1 putative Phytocyanin domain, cupredoxin [Helianthus annuus]KAJ0474883.1 putative Phytocyanin domain, cupredoxin [Helianthus annuus]KAJ0650439.1 putative Phytocyanin domain, cupredoxin [Helianthus annuus]KAJ0654194.1 putative Phytocyanin domain, cupredoxin [Helianthus annuus]